MTIVDRARGALLGVAVGDALGATTEFMSPEAIAQTLGTHRDIVGGGAFGWRPGQGTDDSDLTMAVAKAYVDPGNPVDNARRRFVEWANTNPRDIGGTTAAALHNVAQGARPSGLTTERSCGNGSLMRAIPTAIARMNDPERLAVETAEIGAITHAHPRCIEACVAYNVTAAQLLNGAPPAAAIQTARTGASDVEVLDAIDVDPATEVTQLSTSGYVIDSLRCAIWAIQRFDDSFEDVLVGLVNRGDDADTTGAIAGGLLGAARGANEIPPRWIQTLEYRETIEDLAPALTRASIGH